MIKVSIVSLVLVVLVSAVAQAAVVNNLKDLNKCFTGDWSFEKVKTGNTETITWIDPVDTAARCAIEGIKLASKNKKLALEVGNVIGTNFNWNDALGAYVIAVGANKKLCANENVIYSINSALGLKEGKAVEAAKKLGFVTCWPAVKPGLLKEFEGSSTSGYYYDNACPLLSKLKALDAEQTKKCQPQKE